MAVCALAAADVSATSAGKPTLKLTSPAVAPPPPALDAAQVMVELLAVDPDATALSPGDDTAGGSALPVWLVWVISFLALGGVLGASCCCFYLCCGSDGTPCWEFGDDDESLQSASRPASLSRGLLRERERVQKVEPVRRVTPFLRRAEREQLREQRQAHKLDPERYDAIRKWIASDAKPLAYYWHQRVAERR